MWLLLINEVATTTVEAMARKVGGYLKRWLGFQLSSCTTIIYINWIWVSSVVAECRLAMTSNDSAHNSVVRPGTQTRTGRKWSAKSSVDKQESLIYLLDIIRNTIMGVKTWEGRSPSTGQKHHQWGDTLWTTRNPRGCVGGMVHIISKRKGALIQKRYIWQQSPGGSWLMCCWWRGEGTDHQTWSEDIQFVEQCEATGDTGATGRRALTGQS